MNQSLIEAVRQEVEIISDRNNAARLFVGNDDLFSAWNSILRNPTRYGIHGDSDLYARWEHLIGEEADRRLVTIATILIWCKWDEWARFDELFVSPGRRSKYELPLHQRTARELLGPVGRHVYEQQYIFLPVTISENQDNRCSLQQRLPFLGDGSEPASAALSNVTRVEIAAGHFQNANGELNSKVCNMRPLFPG